MKKWLLFFAKLLVVAIVFWFVRRTIFEAVDKLAEHPWTFRSQWILASAAVYLLGLLPAGLFWRHVLHVLGQDAGLAETLRAYYVGHLGKYVPGKAMVVLLRVGLVRSHRVDTSAAAASVFYETLMMMSVGAFWAAAILAVWFRQHVFLCLTAVGLMAAAGLPILPPIFRRLAKYAGVGRRSAEIEEKLCSLGFGTFLRGVASMTISWLLLAVSLWAVLQSMGVANSGLLENFPLYLASVALSMVAGFLSLIPGGAVVRELILTELIAPHFGNAVALVSAIVLRLVWLGAELLISVILYPFARRRGRFS